MHKEVLITKQDFTRPRNLREDEERMERSKENTHDSNNFLRVALGFRRVKEKIGFLKK